MNSKKYIFSLFKRVKQNTVTLLFPYKIYLKTTLSLARIFITLEVAITTKYNKIFAKLSSRRDSPLHKGTAMKPLYDANPTVGDVAFGTKCTFH